MWCPPPKLTHSSPGRNSPNFASNAATVRASGGKSCSQRVWKCSPLMPARSPRNCERGNAEPRVRRARIVERVLALGLLRVHAQAEAELRPARARRAHERLEALPLRKGVEHHVVGDLQDLREIALGVGGREGVNFPAERVAPESRLVQAARAGAGEIPGDERREAPHRERLEREEDLRPARALDLVEHAQVLLDRPLVDDEAGRRHAARIEPPEPLSAHPGAHAPGGRRGVSPSAHRARSPSRAARACSWRP